MSKVKQKEKRKIGTPLPPSEMAKLRGKKLWIATPCYGGMLTDQFVTSLLKTFELCRTLGVVVYVYFVRNESNIPRARMECTAAYIGRGIPEGYTHFMFIDADTGWHPEYVIRLLLHDKDVIGGTYRKKCQKEEYTVTFLPEAFQVENGICEVQRMGTGFLMLKSKVFEDMMEYYPDLRVNTFSHVLSEEEHKYIYRFFDNLVDEDNTYWGEDYGFCNRYVKMGGKIWCDVTMQLQHIGNYTYEGDVQNVVKWADKKEDLEGVDIQPCGGCKVPSGLSESLSQP